MATGREREIIQSFSDLSDSLVGDFDVLDLAIQLSEDCAKLLDVAAAGLLLADAGGALHLLAATTEQARSLEIFQLQRDEGPCLDCYRSGEPVSVADLHAVPDQWPRFAGAATTQGFRSVHAIPMRLRTNVLGTLGLFGMSPGRLDPDDRNLAQALAHLATIAILRQNHSLGTGSLLPGLHAAVASRAALEVAKGVLAEVHGVNPQEALRRMRIYARAHGTRLTEVVNEVIAGESATRQSLLAELSGHLYAAEV